MANPGAPGINPKPLTGVDRLWQEYKRRHPQADRQDFQGWLDGNPKAKKAVVEGKGSYRYAGFKFTKTGAAKVSGPKAAERREAGAESGLTPKRYSSTGTYEPPGRMPADVARQAERQIRAYFQARGSPLAKYAALFVQAGELSGFDPRFLASIAVWETGAGTAIAYPETRPYNFWNWNNTDSGAVGADAPWQSVETAFKHYGEQFGTVYAGSSNLFQDFGGYATDPSWESKIAGTLRQLGGNPMSVRWGPPAG